MEGQEQEGHKEHSQPIHHEAQHHPKKKEIDRKVVYLVVAAVVVIALVAFYSVYISGGKSGKQKGNSSLSNVTSTSSAQNISKQLFYSDLAKALNVTDLGVVYAANTTKQVVPSVQKGIVVTSNQTISSYMMGRNYDKALFFSQVIYTGSKNNTVLGINTTRLYYYETPNNTVTCLNQSGYFGNAVINTSIRCLQGNGGILDLVSFPFTITNLTSFGYIGLSNITAQGTKVIDGRTCNSFVSSSAGKNLLANYSTAEFCLDTQYGIPIYYNETDVIDGAEYQGLYIVIKSMTTNLSQSDFTIPQTYLDYVKQG